jgi:hypothetical protein
MDQILIEPEHLEGCDRYGATCASCGEHKCDGEDNYGPYHYGNRTGEAYCYPCWESEEYSPSTVHLITAGEPMRKFYITDYHVMDEWGDEPDINIERTYHSSDAWRGYYDTTIGGCVTIEEGADLWGEVTDIRQLAERIHQEAEEGTLPVPVYVITDPTSNVFAVGMGIQVKESDLALFNAWRAGELEEVNA